MSDALYYPNLVIANQYIEGIHINNTHYPMGQVVPFKTTYCELLQTFAERAEQYSAIDFVLDRGGAENYAQNNWGYRKASLLRLKEAKQACMPFSILSFVANFMPIIVDANRELEDTLLACAYEWFAFDEGGCELADTLARPAPSSAGMAVDVSQQTDTLIRYVGTPHRGEHAAWLICDLLAKSSINIKPSLIKIALGKLAQCWIPLLSRSFLCKFCVVSPAQPMSVNLSRSIWIWEIGCRAAPYLYEGEGPDDRSGLGYLRTRMSTGLDYIRRHAPHLLEHVTRDEHKFPDLRIIMAYNPITGTDNPPATTTKRMMSDRKRGVLENLTDQSDSAETAIPTITDPDPDPTTPKEAPLAEPSKTVAAAAATAAVASTNGEPITIIEALVLRPEDSYFAAVWQAIKLGGSTALAAKISDSMTNLLLERLPKALPVLAIPLAIPGVSKVVSLFAPPAIGWLAHRHYIPKMMLSHEKQRTLAKWCILATNGQTTRFLYDLGDDLMTKMWKQVRDILEEEDPDLLKKTQAD